MRIPALGPRGEGWVVAQLALGALIVSVGIAGPEWSSTAKTALLVAGIGIGIAGLALLITGVVALGSSLTPFPKPSEDSTLRSGGAYRLVRHPIYGGLLLLAIGWSVVLSPIALVVTALLAVVLELKARHEESMLAERYPEYEAYRRRVRWRFVPGVR
jgi:protein-S-isoprenylcysteine O-methyltransferase Ste14